MDTTTTLISFGGTIDIQYILYVVQLLISFAKIINLIQYLLGGTVVLLYIALPWGHIINAPVEFVILKR